jgi:hypothetical protein
MEESIGFLEFLFFIIILFLIIARDEDRQIHPLPSALVCYEASDVKRLNNIRLADKKNLFQKIKKEKILRGRCFKNNPLKVKYYLHQLDQGQIQLTDSQQVSFKGEIYK